MTAYKHLLVTGGCGFIGANFIRYLFDEAGFQGRVVNVDLLTYAGNPESLANLDERVGDRYRFVQADICDREAMAGVLDRHDVDAICHFAAESHVDRSIVRPDDFIRTNIVGTYTLLQLARERQERIVRFHHVSTDEVFGSLGASGACSETTPYSPNSPYSASKAASDHLVRAYPETYGLPVTVTNCSNNYGPNQFHEILIPLVINNIRNNRPIPVYGKGENVRDWLYVEDHAAAIDLIFHKGKTGETYNIGGNNEWKNIDLIRLLCRILDQKLGRPEGASQKLITYVRDRPGHDLRYAIDSSKIRSELGWAPIPEFSSGIEKTVDWYLSNDKWLSGILSGDYEKYYEKMYSGRQVSF